LGFLFWKRHSKPIGNASPLFCYLIVLGVVFSSVSVAMWTKAEDAMCVLRGWLLAIGTRYLFVKKSKEGRREERERERERILKEEQEKGASFIPSSFHSFSFSLIFGSLFVREWRLLWIFKNKKTQRRIITNMDLVKGLALIVSLNLIVLIVWTAGKKHTHTTNQQQFSPSPSPSPSSPPLFFTFLTPLY
jgi:hypothetical protein